MSEKTNLPLLKYIKYAMLITALNLIGNKKIKELIISNAKYDNFI